MYVYWRIQQDLNCLGETLVFRDPRFKRTYREWIQKNLGGLAWTQDWSLSEAVRPNTD